MYFRNLFKYNHFYDKFEMFSDNFYKILTYNWKYEESFKTFIW